MKKIFIILIGIALFGCGHGDLDENGFAESWEDTNSRTRGERFNKTDFFIIELDGCEYITGYRNMAHKGDCKNPIHEHNK